VHVSELLAELRSIIVDFDQFDDCLEDVDLIGLQGFWVSFGSSEDQTLAQMS